MKTGKVLLGVLAGVASGALLGILFAPAKGTVTRNKISKKGDDYLEGLKDKFDNFMAEVQNDMEMIKQKANSITHPDKDQS